jgi:AcrR family transcriptional regulator
MARDDVVHGVKQCGRQQGKESGGFPGPPQRVSNEERGPAPGEGAGLRRAVVRYDIQRAQFVRVSAARGHRGLAKLALKGEKQELVAAIARQDELDQMVAEAADAVVEQQMPAGRTMELLRDSGSHAILMNMFTENVKPRKRGRPPGQTPRGAAARDHLYATALQLIATRGYDATTLREIAAAAGVSVGLLYRYFPSKQAIVIALYDELSAEYARQAEAMPAGKWRERFLFALTTSLQVLKPHQVALRALTPVLVGDPDEGIFSESTAFSRLRVQKVFEDAVTGSSDAPKRPLADALGRVLYLVHLAVLLWWLLDKSANQRATTALVAVTRQLLPSAALTLRVPPVRKFVIAVDELLREGLFGAPAAV